MNCVFYPTFLVTLNQMDLIGILRSVIPVKSQCQSAVGQMARMAGRSVLPSRAALHWSQLGSPMRERNSQAQCRAKRNGMNWNKKIIILASERREEGGDKKVLTWNVLHLVKVDKSCRGRKVPLKLQSPHRMMLPCSNGSRAWGAAAPGVWGSPPGVSL